MQNDKGSAFTLAPWIKNRMFTKPQGLIWLYYNTKSEDWWICFHYYSEKTCFKISLVQAGARCSGFALPTDILGRQRAAKEMMSLLWQDSLRNRLRNFFGWYFFWIYSLFLTYLLDLYPLQESPKQGNEEQKNPVTFMGRWLLFKANV